MARMDVESDERWRARFLPRRSDGKRKAVDATPSSRGPKTAQREAFHAKAAKIAKGKEQPRIARMSRMEMER